MTALADESRSLLVLAGIGRPPVETGRHVVDVLMRPRPSAEQSAEAQELLGALLVRVAEAVEILRTYDRDDEARFDALARLTGDQR